MHKKELALTVLAIIAAGASVNFFILGTAGAVPFLEYRNYILIPSLFIILFIAIYGYRKNKRLANRLITGLWIGLVATLALEAARIPSISAHWLPHDDMIALPGMLLTHTPTIESFNAMVGHKDVIRMHHDAGMKVMSENADNMQETSQQKEEHGDHDTMNDTMTHSASSGSAKVQEEQSSQSTMQHESTDTHTAETQNEHGQEMMDSMQPSTSELIVGGLYHFWNGATMAAAYTLMLGKGRWYYVLIWGFIIHIGMMLAPWMLPMVGPFGINYGSGYTIFTASLIAHLGYGAVIGILAQKFIREKGSVLTLLSQTQRS